MEHNGNVPIIGQARTRATFPISVFGHKVDPDGTVPPERVLIGPNGEQIAVMGRGQYVDAEELVEMVAEAIMDDLRATLREVVRDEIKKAFAERSK